MCFKAIQEKAPVTKLKDEWNMRKIITWYKINQNLNPKLIIYLKEVEFLFISIFLHVYLYLIIYYTLLYKNKLSPNIQILVSNAIFQKMKHLEEMASSRTRPEIIQEYPRDFMVL